MDKSWMTKQRLTEEYRNELHRFLDMAFNSVCVSGKIMCPCKYCRNGKLVKRETAEEHLIVDGFMKGYTHWIAHGEDYLYSQRARNIASELQKGYEASSQASADVEPDAPIGHDHLASETATVNKKRARGPTMMPKVWGIQPEKRVVVSFNELGQPNDTKQTSTLAGFLGSIARNPIYCPLHYNDWRKMSNSYKEDMLKLVKARFDLPPGGEEFILTSINKKWKSWKTNVKTSSFDPDVPIDLQIHDLPDDRVDVDQLKALSEHWLSDKFKKSSEMNKETRAKLVDHHHMGQRGYAVLKEIMKGDLGRYPTRAELYEKSRLKPDGSLASYAVRESIEKMKEIATQNPRSSNRSGIIYDHDDEFAKVFGGDKDGRVRLYGLGVKATDIYGGKVSRATLLRQNMEYREELAKLQADFEKFKRGACGTSNMVEQSDSESDQVASPPISRPQKIRVGSFVMLKSLINSSEVVAIGIVNEMGGVRVNGMVLGPAFCNIVVQSIMKKDEHLAFPYGQIQTIEDSLGAPVA